MKSARDLQVQYKCQDCERPAVGFLCQGAGNDMKGLESIKVTRVYPKGTILFIEGQQASAVYMLCQGRVKLSTCSSEGKVIILDIVEAGDVLGLSAALNAAPYEATAEVLELSQVNYVSSVDLLRFLQNNPTACLNAARQLSRNYLTAYKQVCSLGLSESVVDKLARLFLNWCGEHGGNGGPVSLKNSFTHEEMAEMIGTSRETVTRSIKFFRERGLIMVRGSELIIPDYDRLAETIGSRRALRDVM